MENSCVHCKCNNSSSPLNSTSNPTSNPTLNTNLNSARPDSCYVKLNVGGRLFYTTKSTLTRFEGMLKALVLQQDHLPTATDANGWIVIDRSGEYFDFILNYLRDSGMHNNFDGENSRSGLSRNSSIRAESIIETDYERPEFRSSEFPLHSTNQNQRPFCSSSFTPSYLHEMSTFGLKQLQRV